MKKSIEAFDNLVELFKYFFIRKKQGASDILYHFLKNIISKMILYIKSYEQISERQE